jgi:hypothetical protein
MTRAAGDCCGSCKYFHSYYRREQVVGHRWFGFVETYVEAGVVTACRRRLPTVRTVRTDWCGEFEKGEAAP